MEDNNGSENCGEDYEKMKEILIEELKQFAKRADEMGVQPAALVLFALSGSLSEGTEEEFGELAYSFVKKRMEKLFGEVISDE